MENNIKALKFLMHTQKQPQKVVGKTCMLYLGSKEYIVKHYKKRNATPKKSILVFSGFSVKGYKDDRLKLLSKAIASVGYNVFIVKLDTIEDLRISVDTIQEMRECIIHIAKNKHFSYNEKVSIVAPSFSAGMVLNACSDYMTSAHVNAICSIGTFANLASAINYVMVNKEADDYGRNILLYNILPTSKLKNKADLILLLKAAIEDNGYKRKNPMLPEILKTVDNKTKNLWEKLNEDSTFRMELFNQAIYHNEKKNLWEDNLDVMQKIDKCTAPVFLLHGKYDNVILAEQSQMLYQKRIEKKLPTEILLTTLLDHGDTDMGFYQWKEVLKTIQFFSQFFNKAS